MLCRSGPLTFFECQRYALGASTIYCSKKCTRSSISFVFISPFMPRHLQDSLKSKKYFTQADLVEIEYFSHYTQMAFLSVRLLSSLINSQVSTLSYRLALTFSCVVQVAFAWGIIWCCCWQLSDYRRERKRQKLINEAMKGH